MKKVCPKCPLFVSIRGKHPQGEDILDRWGCAFEFMPMLTIENSQMQRQTGSAVESFRNEMVRANHVTMSELANVAIKTIGTAHNGG